VVIQYLNPADFDQAVTLLPAPTEPPPIEKRTDLPAVGTD
jgi:hypothetical protein